MAGQSKVKCQVCSAEVKDIREHQRTRHTFTNCCLLCDEQLADTKSLTTHQKWQHAHMLGYLLPPSEVVEKKEKLSYRINKATIKNEIVQKGISGLGGTWIEDDDFFISYDKKDMRPLVAVELLTKQTLKVVYTPKRDERPYLQDPALPKNQCSVGNLRFRVHNVSHLVTSSNQRLSKQQNDKTFLLRNLVKLHSCVNEGILSSVETHLRQVATNWWKCVLVTVPVYDKRRPSEEGQLAEPVKIVKLMFLGDTQLQIFIVDNLPDLNPSAANFLALRSTLEEANECTGLNLQSELELSWSFPTWKCWTCRFMSDDKEEIYLHDRFEHRNGYCPVHRKRHGNTYRTFSKFKEHVLAGGRKDCEECEKWFYSNVDLNNHRKIVHTKRDVKCTYEGCKKKFKMDFQMKAHRQTHEKKRKRFRCPHCDFSALLKWGVNAHIKLKHRRASNTSPNRVDTRRKIQTKRQSKPQGALSIKQQLAQALQQLSEARQLIAQKDEQIAQLKQQLSSINRKEPLPSTSSSSTITLRSRKKR